MNLNEALPKLSLSLRNELEAKAEFVQIPAGQEILREGQYVKVIPLVLDGLIKVHTKHDDKELLLYYIRPAESCAMSFAASFENEPSKVYATTEEDTTALLIPVEHANLWRKSHADFNTLFFEQFNLRYSELLETIHHVMFNRMDQRLYDHIKERVELVGQNPLKISHRQLANELGTAREVVTRVMKKLETENKVKQHPHAIELL